MSLNNQPTFRFLILALFFLPGLKTASSAQSLKYSKSLFQNKDWSFVENKGQLNNPPAPFQKGESASINDIKYYGHSGGVYLYCKPGMISFVFTKTEKESEQISEATSRPAGFPLPKGAGGFGRINEQPSKITTSPSLPAIALATARADLILLNSNPNSQILASDQQEYYENYYTTGNADSGITNVHTFKTITYKSIYPHIDMVLKVVPSSAKASDSCAIASASERGKEGLEYSFIVYPGGKVSDIQMQWEGIEKIKRLKDSGIEYCSSLGKIDEGKPISFQGENPVKSDFIRHENKVGFKVSEYDKKKVLVIDPTLEWATYFGKLKGENVNNISIDKSGNIFMVGDAQDITGIASTGAYQATGETTFLAKFSPSGKRLWSTYYGDSASGAYCATDANGNVVIAGGTAGKSRMATPGTHQIYYAGGDADAFVAKFNALGKLIWGTYFGGNLEDLAFGIGVDLFGNIFVTGSTDSRSGMATNGAYQTSINAGSFEIFLAKFSSTGSLLWSTYYGEGGAYNYGQGLAADKYGNVYLTGSVSARSGIASSGAYQTINNGPCPFVNNIDWEDAFLAKFSSSGSLDWGTYFGGKNQEEGTSVAIDNNEGVFIAGWTESDSGIASPGAFQDSLSDVYEDGYIAKFSDAGALSWASYFGGNFIDGCTNIACDKSGNVYLTGVTESSSGLATSGAYQTSLSSQFNAFIAEFSSSGSRDWATYFGGNNNLTYPYGIALDTLNEIYISGFTTATSGIATPGAFQQNYSGVEDAFLAKFIPQNHNDAGIVFINLSKDTFCESSQSMGVLLRNYGSKELDSVKINISINDHLQSTYKWTGNLKSDSVIFVSLGTISFQAGIDSVQAWTSMPNGAKDSFPYNDSAILVAKVNPLPIANAGGNYAVCPGSKITLGPVQVPGYNYVWEIKPDSFFSYTANPVVSPDSATTYYLTEIIRSTGCSKTDSAIITIKQLPTVALRDTSICPGSETSLRNSGLKGYTYAWTSNHSGFTSSLSNPEVSPTSSTVYYLTETDSTGCTATDSIIISISQIPKINAGGNHSICIGDSVTIGSLPIDPKAFYEWTTKPAYQSFTGLIHKISPPDNVVYYLVAGYNPGMPYSCYSKDSAMITVMPNPVPDPGPDRAICTGTGTTIGGSAVKGDLYKWTSAPKGFGSGSSDPVVYPDTNTTYILTEINTSGCTATSSVTITLNPIPKPNPGPSKILCSGDTVSIGANNPSGYLYSWRSLQSSNYPMKPRIIIIPVISSWYILTSKDSATGCSGKDSIYVYVDPLPKPKITGSTEVCTQAPNIYTTQLDSGSKYLWTLKSGQILSGKQSDSVHLEADRGFDTIIVKETDVNGCKNTDSLLIHASPIPDAHWKLLSDSPVYIFKAIDSTEQYYQWLFGDGGTGYSYLESHKYDFTKDSNLDVSLTVGSAFGCSATFDSTIKFRYNPPPDFYIGVFPNPFGESTNIKISVSQSSHIRIVAYDDIGRLIVKLADVEQPAGITNYELDAAKYSLAYGVYYLEILIDGKVYVKPVVRVE